MKNSKFLALLTIVVVGFGILGYFEFQTTDRLDDVVDIITTPQNFDYILYMHNGLVVAKNSTNQIEFSTSDFSWAVMQAVERGKNIAIQANEYSLQSDLIIANKSDVTLIGSGSTINCNGYRILVSGIDYLHSKSNTLAGMRIINGSLKIEDSFSTVLNSLTFQDCPTAVTLSNKK